MRCRHLDRHAALAGAEIFDAILNRQPTPAVRINPGVALERERIIDKALEKDREIRYQHAADMRSDLKRVKRDSESQKAVSVASATSVAQGTGASKNLFAVVGLLLATLLAGFGISQKIGGELLQTLRPLLPRHSQTCAPWRCCPFAACLAALRTKPGALA